MLKIPSVLFVVSKNTLSHQIYTILAKPYAETQPVVQRIDNKSNQWSSSIIKPTSPSSIFCLFRLAQTADFVHHTNACIIIVFRCQNILKVGQNLKGN